MNDNQIISTFLEHQLGRGFSANTVKRRRSSLARFARSLAPLPLISATPELVEEFVYRFKAPNTRHAYRSDIIMFYRWATRRMLLHGNPAADTDNIKTPRPLPKPIPGEMIPVVVDRCQDPTIRLWCALALFAGLRCSEIADLERSEVVLHGTNPTVTVRNGKGGKDRVIPLHPRLTELITPYRRSGRMFDCDAETVSRWGATYLRSLGLDATMHHLRHTFGTELARASAGNVVLVAYLMGHSSVQTTMGYIGWAGGESTEIIASMYQPPDDEDDEDRAA